MTSTLKPTQEHIGWATSIAQHLCASADQPAAIRLVADAFNRFEQEKTAAMVEALVDVAASLAAAISLLERGGKAAKKAAPSDKMFDQMLKDYTASLERARAALGGQP